MGRETERPLSVTEAKNRLRRTAEDLPTGYVRRHPFMVLGLAFMAGYFLGGSSSSHQLMTRAMLKAL